MEAGKSDRRCRTLRSMARIYTACGDYAKAQPLAEQALTLAQQTNVSDTELALSLLDLAYIYRDQGNPDRAEKMCELGLKLQKKVYYEDHPHIAYTLRILASVHEEQARYNQAQEDLQLAVAIMKKSHLYDQKPLAPFPGRCCSRACCTGPVRRRRELLSGGARDD